MKHKLLFCLLSATACTSSPSAQKYNGEPYVFLNFNGQDIDIIEELPKKNGTVIVASVGGDIFEAKRASELLLSKFDNILIGGLCLSACAEILVRMASAEEALELNDEALIGFHHTPQIFIQSAAPGNRPIGEKCLSRELNEMRAVRGLLDEDDNLTDIQMEVLGYRIGSVKFRIDCDNTYSPPPVRFWFPDSRQLDNLFGIKISDNYCADNIDCFKEKWAKFAKSGDQFVVGKTRVTINRIHDGRIAWEEEVEGVFQRR